MKIKKIKAILLERDLSFADIDRKYGLNYGGARRCLSYPREEAEKAISKELGVELKILFPERYDKNNHRLKPIPIKLYAYKKEKVKNR